MSDQLWLTLKEASSEYGHGIDWWRKRSKDGVIKAKLGAKIYLERASIEAYMSDGLKGAVKDADILAKANREASLAQAKADKAEAENKEGEAKQAITLRKAGMSVEDLKTRELALGETLLEIERLMDNLAGVKKRLNLQFGQEFIERWNELAVYVNQKLGKDDRQENTSEGVE